MKNCPHCSKLLGFFGGELIPQSKIDFINKFTGRTSAAYCTQCSPSIIENLSKRFKQEKEDLEKRLKAIINYVPIITSIAPNHWEYKITGLVTSQVTSGTGFMTELSRSFNDFFGAGSATSNRKIAAAIENCKSELRIQSVKLGGNAIVSADIDFNEIGSGSTNMLMVCMTGTAVKVNKWSDFDETTNERIEEVLELIQKLDAINQDASSL